MPIESGYQGFADLGAALAGGGGMGQRDAFYKGATQAATLESALARAKVQRDEALQRENIRSALAGLNLPPEQTELLEVLMRSGTGSDFSSGMTGLGTNQRNQGRQVALDQALAGAITPETFNAGLAVSNDTPIRTTQIDEGYAINPYGDPGQKPQATDVALSRVLANEAAANSRNAQAGASNARAENIRDRTANPDKYRAKKNDEASTPGGLPKVGDVRKGYRFNGGDPAKRENWSKAN